jgi:hypothetical protein
LRCGILVDNFRGVVEGQPRNRGSLFSILSLALRTAKGPHFRLPGAKIMVKSMWEGWYSKLEPDLRSYWRMVGPIELMVRLTRVRDAKGDEWDVYFDGYATVCGDSGGPYFAQRFNTLEVAETAVFRACCERIKFITRDVNTNESSGLAYLKLGQFDNAIAKFNAALLFAPELATSLYGRGVAKLKKGDTAAGNADIAAAEAIQPDIARQMADTA